MDVPHTNKRPASAGILQIRVQKIGAVEGAVIVDGGRHVKVTNLLALGITNYISQPPRVHALRSILGIPHNFVNEIAEM